MGKKQGWVPIGHATWTAFRRKGNYEIRCGHCGHIKVLPGRLLEDYRVSQSFSGRMQRAGQSMQTLGVNQTAKLAFQGLEATVGCSECGSIAPERFFP